MRKSNGETKRITVAHSHLAIDVIRNLANQMTAPEWSPVKVKDTYTWSEARQCYV